MHHCQPCAPLCFHKVKASFCFLYNCKGDICVCIYIMTLISWSLKCLILLKTEENKNQQMKEETAVRKWLQACKLSRQEQAALLGIFFSPSAFAYFTLAYLSRCKSYWEIWLCMLKRHKYRGKNITSRWPYYTQYVTCSSNIAFICHYYHPQLLWVGGILNWQRGPLTKC